jgi:excisionase family DNA binding protein
MKKFGICLFISLIITLVIGIPAIQANDISPVGEKIASDSQGRAIYQVSGNGIKIGYVFPTGVGMNRRCCDLCRIVPCVPHLRGDERGEKSSSKKMTLCLLFLIAFSGNLAPLPPSICFHDFLRYVREFLDHYDRNRISWPLNHIMIRGGNNMGDEERQMLDPKTAARILGKPEGTVRRWLREGQIRARKLGRSWLIPRDEINRILNVGDVEAAKQESGEKEIIPSRQPQGSSGGFRKGDRVKILTGKYAQQIGEVLSFAKDKQQWRVKTPAGKVNGYTADQIENV